MPGWMRNSKPKSLSKPEVRFLTTDPSLLDTRTMSSSWSFRLTVTCAMRSPDGEGSAESTSRYFVFSGLGARLRP